MVVHYVSSVQLYYTKAKTSTCGHYRTVIIYDDTEILIDNEKISFKKVNLNEGEILKDTYIYIFMKIRIMFQILLTNGHLFPDLFKRTFYTRHFITTGSKYF